MELVAHSPNERGEWHRLGEHLRAVETLSGEFGAAFDSRTAAAACGLVHDLGKADPDWQDYLRRAAAGERPASVDHKTAGAHVLVQDGRCPALATVVLAHHGGLPHVEEVLQVISTTPTTGQGRALACRRAMGIDVPDLRTGVPAQVVPQDRRDTRAMLERDLWLRMLLSCLVDADRLDTERHFCPAVADVRGVHHPSMEELDRRLHERLPGALHARLDDPVSEARAELLAHVVADAERDRGWFELTAPTGSGKTIAALAFALRHAAHHDLRRVVCAVPFVSVTEQIAQVYTSLLDQNEVLEHHSGAATAREDQVGGGLWARLAVENWDSPVIVTTTVQLLESLFAAATSKVRKVHRLAKSVIIIDEAQSIPWRLVEPTLDVLASLVTHYGCTVVLATATQPPFGALDITRRAAPAPLVPQPLQDRFPQRVRAEPMQHLDHEGLADAAAHRAARNHGQCLAVLNTIADATRSARQLAGIDGLHYLSTRLCPAHRRFVLGSVVNRLELGQPCLVVSTQLVEAGVDIDFPTAIRAVGPLPAIVQVAGRVNRHGRRADASILPVELIGGCTPPAEYRIGTQISRDLLRSGADPLARQTLAEYYERFIDATRSQLDHHDIQKLRSVGNFPEVARRYQLIVDDTVDVLVPYAGFDPATLVLPGDPTQRRMRLRRLQPFFVALRQRAFARAREDGTVTEIGDTDVWRWTGTYDPVYGLADEYSDEAVIW